MPAYPTAYTEYDFQNAATYPGTGNTVYDLQAANVDLEVAAGTWVSGSINYWNLLGNTNIFNANPGATFQDESFTVTCWYYPNFTNPSNYATVWSMGTDGNSTRPMLATESNGTMNIQWSFGFAAIPYTPTIDWHMFTFVSTGTGGSTTLYVDGQYVGTNAQVGTIAGNALIRLGAGNNGSNNPWEYAYGRIGYWSYHTTALTPTNILDQYNSTVNTYYPGTVPVLVGSYDFSDPSSYPGTGDTVFDLTANNNDLVMNGTGAQPSYGGTGQSKYFSFVNNNTNHLYCSQFSALGTTFGGGNFTLSAWHNYDNAQQDNAAILFGGNGQNNDGVTIQVTGNDGNKIYGGIFGDPPAVGIANTANTWHMSTLTGDGTTLKLYQDGAFIGSTSQSGSWNGRGFVLGRYLDSSYEPVGTSNQLRYAGLIGIAEVYDGALGSTAISNLYATQQPRFYPTPPAPATLKYDFSDPACYPGTGNTIYDLSGYGLDATFTSGTASSFVGAGTSSYFNFDGTGYITTETYANPTPTEWTMLSWVNFSSTSPYGLIMSTAESNTSGGVPHTVWGLTANTIASSNGNNVASISNPSTSNLNEWYMVTYTSDGTTLRLYVNDTQVGSTAISGAFISGTSPYVRLAQYSGVLDSGLNGKIAYAEFYAGNGLTAGEVSTIFTNEASRFGITPPAPPSNVVGGRQFAQGFNG